VKYHLQDLKDKDLAELFLEAGLIDSKNEARRLMKQGGLKIGEYTITPDHKGLWGVVIPGEFQIVLSRGKKKKNLLTIETDGMQMVPL
jgi:tyrosyl-tRNA synthetase